jgi:hypothetical protein
MPEISWLTMRRINPAAHLVVGVIPAAEEAEASGLKMRAALLSRVARALRLTGLYAIVDLPERSGNEIRCSFEKPADADRLAKAVGASDETRYPGWASQRSFLFDAAAVTSLQATLRDVGSATRHRRKSRASNLF